MSIHINPLMHKDPSVTLYSPTDLDRIKEQNNRYREWGNATKLKLECLVENAFIPYQRLQKEDIFMSDAKEIFLLKKGKIFSLQKGNIFVSQQEEIFLTAEAKQFLLKEGRDFLLIKGRVFLSQIGEVYQSEDGGFFLIEKGERFPLKYQDVLPKDKRIFLSEEGKIFFLQKGSVFTLGKEVFFLPDKEKQYRVKEKLAGLDGAVKRILVRFLLQEYDLIKDYTQKDKKITDLEGIVQKANKQDKNIYKENQIYIRWINNIFTVKQRIKNNDFSHLSGFLQMLSNNLSHFREENRKKAEKIASLEAQTK